MPTHSYVVYSAHPQSPSWMETTFFDKEVAWLYFGLAAMGLIHSVIQLSYFGATFESDKKTLDADDWRRKYLIVFAYLNIVVGSVMASLRSKFTNWSSNFPMFFLLLPLMGVVTLKYLGTSFGDVPRTIPTDAWERKVLIFFAWFYQAVIITLAVLLSNGLYKIRLQDHPLMRPHEF